MAIKMMGNKSAIESTPINIPDGLTKLKLSGLTASRDKKNTPDVAVMYRFIFDIVGQNKADGSPINVSSFVSSKAFWIQNDICHALGVPMEEQGDSICLPGEFDGPADDPTKWQYRGPLMGREGNFYLEKQDKYSNIKYAVCAIPDCPTRFPKTQHGKDLLKKK